ncbi:hypothetical protein THAOC_23047 [Thalassiosira oceanica]|uniref:Uncharacterized protein n=1 Tax=Thalassiosira oceanica TaxID=159749 RepID=K0RWW9_THAOC|nr:hypothetical protein THAOC_23047 [Thalassiosira oceanica]|eukprot:EJK56964.1 hypothetical protein THAOC_23047 [Thalassiosira oceanica]
MYSAGGQAFISSSSFDVDDGRVRSAATTAAAAFFFLLLILFFRPIFLHTAQLYSATHSGPGPLLGRGWGPGGAIVDKPGLSKHGHDGHTGVRRGEAEGEAGRGGVDVDALPCHHQEVGGTGGTATGKVSNAVASSDPAKNTAQKAKPTPPPTPRTDPPFSGPWGPSPAGGFGETEASASHAVFVGRGGPQSHRGPGKGGTDPPCSFDRLHFATTRVAKVLC